MRILAVDPGNTMSAYVIWDGERIIDKDKLNNDAVIRTIEEGNYDLCVIELMACYGMSVGKEVFDTCYFIGRMQQVLIYNKKSYSGVLRKDIKMHHCGTVRAKDANIRQAIIDRFPATGGGKIPQIGLKKSPGPLYGVAADEWSALAIGMYTTDKMSKEEKQ